MIKLARNLTHTNRAEKVALYCAVVIQFIQVILVLNVLSVAHVAMVLVRSLQILCICIYSKLQIKKHTRINLPPGYAVSAFFTHF